MSNTGKRHPSPSEITAPEDESPLFKVFRTSPVAMTVHRLSDRQFAYVNSAFESLSGWKLEEVVGRTMAELNMVDVDVAEQMGSRLENEGVLRDVEGILTTRSDEGIPVSVSTELVDLQGVQHAITTYLNGTQRDRVRAAESRLKALWKSSLDALVVMDKFGNITDFNPAAEKIFGYSAKDVMGAALAEKLISPNDRERHRNGIKRFLATGDGPLIDNRIEVSALRSDGKEFPIELTVTAADEPGDPSFVVTVRDLTERRQSEEALRESESRYRTLVDSAPEGIFIHQGKQVVFANPALVQMLRAESAEEIIGKEPFTFVHPDYHDHVAATIETLSEVGDQTGVLERKFLRKDGSTADVEVAASKVLFEGRPAIQVYVRDVTERKQAQESLATQTEMLTTVTEALAEYVERGNWRTAMGRLLRTAVAETKSEYGFVGVVVGTTLRVLAHEGIVWDEVVNRDFYDQAMRSYEELGYLEFPSFNNLFGRAVTTGRV
ncbi:MAG: PAS domain S-box protein, partial [Blastocatellia bacterium]|nr:PAS domain S-box protein [Blastocatellia bacterium]